MYKDIFTVSHTERGIVARWLEHKTINRKDWRCLEPRPSITASQALTETGTCMSKNALRMIMHGMLCINVGVVIVAVVIVVVVADWPQ